MTATLPILTGLLYWRTRARLTLRQDLADAVSIGFIAVALAGVTFFLQLSPEDLRILHDVKSAPLPVLGSYHPSLWEWRFVQRLIVFPLAGLLGPLLVLLVRGDRRGERGPGGKA